MWFYYLPGIVDSMNLFCASMSEGRRGGALLESIWGQECNNTLNVFGSASFSFLNLSFMRIFLDHHFAVGGGRGREMLASRNHQIWGSNPGSTITNLDEVDKALRVTGPPSSS